MPGLPREIPKRDDARLRRSEYSSSLERLNTLTPQPGKKYGVAAVPHISKLQRFWYGTFLSWMHVSFLGLATPLRYSRSPSP